MRKYTVELGIKGLDDPHITWVVKHQGFSRDFAVGFMEGLKFAFKNVRLREEDA